MGPTNFYPWIKRKGYQPKPCYVSTKDHLLIDAKAMMYRVGYSIPIDSVSYHQDITDLLISGFGHFSSVTFVNDGKMTERDEDDNLHPKHETNCKRGKERKRQRDEVEISSKRLKVSEEEYAALDCVEAENLELEIEKIDRKARAARGISYDDSIQIMHLLEALPNFTCIQVEIGEADPVLISMAAKFDFVLSEDADLLCGGVLNLLRGFGSANQCCYNANDILHALKLSLEQLQEIVCISGNDYRRCKIKNMGLEKAYDHVRRHGNCENMIARWESHGKPQKFQVPENFANELQRAILLYNPPKSK